MEIAIESFLIFTSLMFWIMFYNKKGLLAEIRKTEKIITEKIIVLEDLVDSSKKLNQPIDLVQSKIADTKQSPTELRTLSLEDAKKIDFIEQPKVDTAKKVVSKSKPKTNVQSMVLQARENMKQIDVPDFNEIKSFKDVVLMSKKIEQEKKLKS